MSSIILRNPNPLKQTNWSTFDEFDRLVNRIFNSYNQYGESESPALVPVELIEKDDEFMLKVMLPGMKKENINIEVSEDGVSISGEYKTQREEEKENVYRSEFFEGKFERNIAMPKKIDHQKAKAEYKDGILSLELPKSEQETKKVVKLSLD